MPRIFTVEKLVLLAQQRADMEEQDFILAPEWLFHLSTAYAELHSILVESGMRYFERTQTIATRADVAAYALPDDFLSSIAVDRIVNATTNERRELTELMVQERNVYTRAGASESVAFSYVGPDIVLYPTPPASQTYEHLYVPQPKDLNGVANNTEVDVVTPDGEAFVLWTMCVLARDKEESDITSAEHKRSQAEARLREWSVLRALNNPRRRIVADEDWAYRPGDWRGGWR